MRTVNSPESSLSDARRPPNLSDLTLLYSSSDYFDVQTRFQSGIEGIYAGRNERRVVSIVQVIQGIGSGDGRHAIFTGYVSDWGFTSTDVRASHALKGDHRSWRHHGHVFRGNPSCPESVDWVTAEQSSLGVGNNGTVQVGNRERRMIGQPRFFRRLRSLSKSSASAATRTVARTPEAAKGHLV